VAGEGVDQGELKIGFGYNNAVANPSDSGGADRRRVGALLEQFKAIIYLTHSPSPAKILA